MSAMPDSRRMSEAEYLRRERASDVKHEYIDGYAVAMVGASQSHVTIASNLVGLLHAALRGTPCTVKTSDLRVRIAAVGDYVYPDVTVICGDPQYVETEPNATLTNPTLIIEVLSPSTEAYDRGRKFQSYETLPSLRDYVLVAQDAALIECFSRSSDDPAQWVRTKAAGLAAAITLPALALTLALADVYEDVDF